MILDIGFETMPREDLETIQLRRLKATLERVNTHVPFYKSRFEKAGISPYAIKSLSDLKHLPFTTKEDIRANYPFGLFAVRMETVVRIQASSGTTGKPIVAGYTARDIKVWAECMARALAAGGATRDDIIHNAFSYGLFSGGLGFHYGAELLGASVIPLSTGNSKRQITILADFKPTILACTPSYALHLREVADDMGVDFAGFNLKYGMFGGEPWTEKMRSEIERKLNLSAIDLYGLTEIMGPGVAVECHDAKNGLHIFEDHFIPEIIDPVTGNVLPHGETGELVFTSLSKEAFPMIRFRTRDITSLNPEPCKCGRTHIRMNRIMGRSDDMISIRGVNVFPSQIENVLMGIDDITPHYQLVLERKENLDVLTVMVEAGGHLFSDEVKRLQNIKNRITKQLKDVLGVSAVVQLVEPRSLNRENDKIVRVVDNRHLF